MLEVHDLAKAYTARKRADVVRAVDGINFSVEPGQTFGLLGPNGAGKTTTVRMLAGLLQPSAGSVRFDGLSVAEAPAMARKQMGMVTEASGVYDKLTAYEYLAFFGGLYGLGPERIRARAEALLRDFALRDCAERRVQTFSKGMKQKLNLARALLHEPRLLLLDEPTSGLDPAATEMLLGVLDDLRQRLQAVTVLCTHNLDEADRLCDRIAILAKGRIVREGSPGRLKQNGNGQVLRVTLAAPHAPSTACLQALPGVTAVKADGAVLEVCTADSAATMNPAIARALIESGADLLFLEAVTVGLKDVYLQVVREASA